MNNDVASGPERDGDLWPLTPMTGAELRPERPVQDGEVEGSSSSSKTELGFGNIGSKPTAERSEVRRSKHTGSIAVGTRSLSGDQKVARLPRRWPPACRHWQQAGGQRSQRHSTARKWSPDRREVTHTHIHKDKDTHTKTNAVSQHRGRALQKAPGKPRGSGHEEEANTQKKCINCNVWITNLRNYKQHIDYY